MKIAGGQSFLSLSERERIHAGMVRILDEVGLVVENDRLLERLSAIGGRIQKAEPRVVFAPENIDRFIAESEPQIPVVPQPPVSGSTGVYYGHYLNPETNDYEPWDTARLLHYLKIAHHLSHTRPFLSVIVPLQGVPEDMLVPFYHYLTFKFLGRSACGINDTRWNPCILEMCEAAADDLNVPIWDVFAGYVFLIPPLKLAHQEADIVEYWASRGIPLHIGNMTSAGGTAPVTLAGAVAQHLAQEFAINLLRRACFGVQHLEFASCISHLDMRTGMFPYGRPEHILTNLAMLDMARHYQGRFHPQTALSDAKRPSAEAGFQKGAAAMASLMACGSATVACGLLSVDEVFSPIQMIIDNEIVSALSYLAAGFEVADETLAINVIKSVGPGGQFLDTNHTLEHFREAVWEPRIFSREMFAGWQHSGGKTDIDYAKDIYQDLAGRDALPPRISDRLERRLIDIVQKHTGRQIAGLVPE